MEEARFEMRYGTQDSDVFNEVVVANQYKLPDKIPSDKLIIDVGANIGCFAVACLLRGAESVICFEPCQDNFTQLSKNLSPWEGKVAAFMAAVWRSDIEQEISISTVNGTASCSCFPTSLVNHNESRVNAIGLDEVISQATEDGRRIGLLKIDAEYSEYPILFSSKNLGLVDEIVGETHEWGRDGIHTDGYYKHPVYKNNAEEVHRFLRDQGFEVTSQQEKYDNQTNTLFFAKRPEQK
jgi:FkbM family methyltransferase